MNNIPEKICYISACKECGVVVEYDKRDVTHNYYCPRCGYLIYGPGESFAYVIIMALTSLVVFLPTLYFPILTLDMAGHIQSTTIISVVSEFYKEGGLFISVVVAFTGIGIPVMMLLSLLWLLIPLHLGKRPLFLRPVYSVYSAMKHWGMAEVYMLSILVASIKLQNIGDLSIDVGFFIFVFFLICFYITIVWFNPDDIWHNNAIHH
jgi:paraquat-inducible protein A